MTTSNNTVNSANSTGTFSDTTAVNSRLAASYWAVLNAEKENQALGHENKGFLSFDRGFMPNTPIRQMPERFAAWDELAAQLPSHYKNQTLRNAIKALPVLIPSEENLSDEYLCRASLLVSIFAHAYVRCERHEDLNIPDSVMIPWQEITRRLKRPAPFLSYIDLIVYNWKMRDVKGHFEVDNLDLMVYTVGNKEERLFYLIQVEILEKSTSVVREVVEIQNAILENDVRRVITGLHKIRKVMQHITEYSFLKISLNPRSSTFVDPVVWAKTVAPFAVPLKEGVQGPSGMASPIFHLMDTFIERNKFDSILGKEALFLREWFPQHWKDFYEAVDQVSLSEFVKRANSEELDGAYYSLMESYSGKQGFLGAHKRKVYGYLQTAFKIGRSSTIAGFSGLFKERTWEQVDHELEKTRMERYVGQEFKCPFATISSRKSVSEYESEETQAGLAGKVNDAAVVASVLQKLNLSGSTLIQLNREWQSEFQSEYLPLERVLHSGRLDKVNMDGIKNTELANTECFKGILRANVSISFADFIAIVTAHGTPAEVLKEGYMLTNLLSLIKKQVSAKIVI